MRSVVAVVALISCVHAGLWALLHRQQPVPNIEAPLASVSYSPYTRWQNPDRGDVPTPEQIRSDLRLLSPYTRTVRTYTSTRGLELVPAIAAEFGMKVTVGIWLDPIAEKKTGEPIEKNVTRNKREIDQAIALAKRYSNVNAIVIAEFGWPSAGYNMHDADPGRIEQATVIRDFIARANSYGIDYNIIEAIDQPHKTNEGGVGAYWGLFDVSRDAKFAWTGPVSDPDYWKIAGIAVLLGLLMSLTILAKPRATNGEAGLLGGATNRGAGRGRG